MYYYLREIKSGDVIEKEYYKSIRKRNKKNIGRSARRSLTPEKQKKANDIRAEKKTQRLLLNNFKPGDMWLTLTYRNKNTEDEILRDVRNYLRRLKYFLQKNNLPALKYKGVIARGERGKWHAHIAITKIDYEAVTSNWEKGSVTIRALYESGYFKDLANYIHKHTHGESHQIQSRNLVPPEEKVTELSRRQIRNFELGEIPDIPQGYYLYDFETTYNDLTGTAARFYILPISYKAKEEAEAPPHEE